MFKQKFWFCMFRYSVSSLRFWPQNTHWHLRIIQHQNHGKEGFWTSAFSAFHLGQLRMAGLGAVLSQHLGIISRILESGFCSYVYTPALNMSERFFLTLIWKGTACSHTPGHSDWAAKREWSHLHIKSSAIPRNNLGGSYLAQKMIVSGKVVMI